MKIIKNIARLILMDMAMLLFKNNSGFVEAILMQYCGVTEGACCLVGFFVKQHIICNVKDEQTAHAFLLHEEGHKDLILRIRMQVLKGKAAPGIVLDLEEEMIADNYATKRGYGKPILDALNNLLMGNTADISEGCIDLLTTRRNNILSQLLV
jgi:hypothetical protein